MWILPTIFLFIRRLFVDLKFFQIFISVGRLLSSRLRSSYTQWLILTLLGAHLETRFHLRILLWINISLAARTFFIHGISKTSASLINRVNFAFNVVTNHRFWEIGLFNVFNFFFNWFGFIASSPLSLNQRGSCLSHTFFLLIKAIQIVIDSHLNIYWLNFLRHNEALTKFL